jgi:hypothetical protein
LIRAVRWYQAKRPDTRPQSKEVGRPKQSFPGRGGSGSPRAHRDTRRSPGHEPEPAAGLNLKEVSTHGGIVRIRRSTLVAAALTLWAMLGVCLGLVLWALAS